jgi:23S rRNA pseudouridine1911/1915/1917 synthase
MADSNQINLHPSFRILFEDQHLIVLSKAAGVLSQSDHSGEASLVDLLRDYFGRHYVGLLHRLDRNTTGLMIVAKRSKSAERLTEQLQKGELTRTYHAILYGDLYTKLAENGSVRWEHWLFKNESTNEVKIVNPHTPKAKHATLTVTPIQLLNAEGTAVTLAKFELETGRSHQIRVQSQASGHPLIGDAKYGHAKSMALFPRPALHSSQIEFYHPISREKMAFQERYSADMIACFPALSDD